MKEFGEFIGVLIIVILLLCIAPVLFMVAWNYIAPLFWANAPQLGFIQALCIVLIFRILFGNNVNVQGKD